MTTRLELSNRMTVHGLPGHIEQEIISILTLPNPAYLDAKKMNRWTGNLKPYLHFYEQPGPGEMIIPRGMIGRVEDMLSQNDIPFEVADKTRFLNLVDFSFLGNLRPYQKEAAEKILLRREGVLQAPTGSGKTILSLYVIAERKQPALVIVHTKELLNQWVDRIHSFMGIPFEDVGMIGNGKKRIGRFVTVAMVQTLHKCKEDIFPHIGFLLVDECHRCPSRTFTEAVTAFDALYVLGLSATPYRNDGLTDLIHFYLGEEIHSIDQDTLTHTGAILPFHVNWIHTDFNTSLDASADYPKVLSELTQDFERNYLICREAAEEIWSFGGMVLVLTDRKAHCQALSNILDELFNIKAEVLTGDLSGKARDELVSRLYDGYCDVVLIATVQLIGEGFDLPALNTVLLGTPIRFKGRLLQAIGRALRPSPGQAYANVIDFVDRYVGVLRNSALARQRIYEQYSSEVRND